MRHETVILVLAHKIKPLEDLLRLLGPSFPVIIHLDIKARGSLCELSSRVSLLENRRDIYWGGISMFLSIRDLIDEAYRIVPDFSRAVLISGDSLPLMHGVKLHEAFANQSFEYIGLSEVANDRRLRGLTMEEARVLSGGSVLPWRFQNFCFYDNNLLNPRTISAVKEEYDIVQNTASHIRGSVKTIAESISANIPQRPDLYSKFFYGEAWWALTRATLDLVIDDIHSSLHLGFFEFLQAPEEHFIHTILGNKMRALKSMRRQIICSPVFVDHKDPARSSLGHDALASGKFRAARDCGPYLFARKYDPEYSIDIAAAIIEGTYFETILGQSV